MIDAARLVAPQSQHGLLIEPAAETWAELPRASEPALAVRVLDTTVGDLRLRLRQRLGPTGPVVATGHQAEFFHAGVLAKTIAAQHVAQRWGGAALFVTVDSDLAKIEQLAVPQETGSGLRRVEVRMPGVSARMPVEHLSPTPRQHWLDFFARVAAIMPNYEESAIRAYAEGCLAAGSDEATFTARLEGGNAAVEARLGANGVPVLRASDLSQTAEFRAVVAHIVGRAGKFAAAYNAAQAAYRERHRIRSVERPVPALAVAAGRIELPLWVSRVGDARRRLYIRQADGEITFFADTESIGVVSADALRGARSDQEVLPAHVAALFRPRALLFSWFLRMFVADLFIHGIGGARYDEITDEFSRVFFGAAPPALACVSATLRLPLTESGRDGADLERARRAARDVRHNPQRYVARIPDELAAERHKWIRESDRLRATQPQLRPERRIAYQGIRRANERILAVDPWRAAALDQDVQALELRRQVDRIALDREYFYGLHPIANLREMADGLRAALAGA